MTQLTWSDVLKREDLVGGSVELSDDDVVYRAPLSKVKEVGDQIIFESPWCARMNPDTDDWEKWHITSWSVNKSFSRPRDDGLGQIKFVSFGVIYTIIPKGRRSKLDPGVVKGLETRFVAA